MKKRQYELYDLPKRLRKADRCENAVWMSTPVIIMLVLGLSALDAATLYTVFDKLRIADH